MPIWNRADSARRVKHTVKNVVTGVVYGVQDGDRIAADSSDGVIMIDATDPSINSFWVFDAYNTFNIYECQVEFDGTTTVILDNRGDYFYFYKSHGVWHWQELVQYSTGELQ